MRAGPPCLSDASGRIVWQGYDRKYSSAPRCDSCRVYTDAHRTLKQVPRIPEILSKLVPVNSPNKRKSKLLCLKELFILSTGCVSFRGLVLCRSIHTLVVMKRCPIRRRLSSRLRSRAFTRAFTHKGRRSLPFLGYLGTSIRCYTNVKILRLMRSTGGKARGELR